MCNARARPSFSSSETFCLWTFFLPSGRDLMDFANSNYSTFVSLLQFFWSNLATSPNEFMSKRPQTMTCLYIKNGAPM